MSGSTSKLKRMHVKTKQVTQQVEGLRTTVRIEQVTRTAAQRGLVPYVRSLQRFNEWLSRRPELQAELEPILRELKLWDVRLGYDPDTDPALNPLRPPVTVQP